MNEAMLRAFLEDIKAQPDDDTARLILADWLQENGETEADRDRGELIRLECAAARPAGESDTPTRERIDELFQAHRSTWQQAIGLPGGTIATTRGLVELWTSPGQLFEARLLEADDTVAWAWIDELRLTGEKGRHETLPDGWWPRFLASSLAGYPARLALRDIELSRADMRALADWSGLARLQGLSLFACGTTDDDTAALLGSGNLGQVRRLQLSRGQLQAPSLERVLRDRTLTALRDLDLGWNEIASEPLPLLIGAVFREQLKSLSLWSNPIGEAGARALAVIDLPALTRLDLGFCEIGPLSLERLAAAPWMGQLEELHLASNPLGDGVPALLAAPLDRLRILRMNFGSLPSTHVEALVGCPRLSRLRDLSLYGNEFTAHDMDTLVGAWRLPAVRDLDLCMNHLGDEGARTLAAWPGLCQLRHLDLSHTDLTDDGLRALLTSPHLDAGTELLLYGNQASDGLKQEAAAMNRKIDV